jgi:predicted AlkP superfamily pyrophosphatase or phosphodiesterase
MRWYSKFASAACIALLQACTATPSPVGEVVPVTKVTYEGVPGEVRAPVTILVSIDGFRADYLGKGNSPNLDALAAGGVTAAMRPSFPSKTFPNHWTLVTGKRPDRNGIVANSFEDAARPEQKFTMEDSKDPFWWNQAEPIWVAAEKQGVRTATMFWPGSNVAWGGTMAEKWPNDVTGGTRPRDWWPFDMVIDGQHRVDGLIDWLRRPAGTRPHFLTLYFDTVDTAGHKFGPGSADTADAVRKVDALIGSLTAQLRDLGQSANLVIVADHGMAPTSFTRAIAIDKVADPADYRVFESGPYASFYPVAGHEAALEKALLRPHEHMQCWRKGEIPARFHYGTNPRVPPYFCLAETGWLILKTTPTKEGDLGNHGYDNMAPEMAALFVANGPAFVGGSKLEPFDNVDVAPLIRDLLALPALPAGTGLDGDDAPFKAVLATPAP